MDGMENIAGRLTEYCTLRVCKGLENHLQTFYITALGADRAILGYPWLKQSTHQLGGRKNLGTGNPNQNLRSRQTKKGGPRKGVGGGQKGPGMGKW